MSNPFKLFWTALVATVVLLSSVNAFSPSKRGFGLRPCVSNSLSTPFTSSTQLAMAKKKKKKKPVKRKPSGDAPVAVLERPPEPAPVIVEEVPSVDEDEEPVAEMEEPLVPVKEIVPETPPAKESEAPATSTKASFDQKQQPLSANDEARVAAKYAAIQDIGERAFAILTDLGCFDRED